MDAARFERLANRHRDAVYRQMVRVCRNADDAADALATAMMQAFQAAEQLDSEDAFRAWLATIGRRVCARMRSHPAIRNVLEFAEERGLISSMVEEMEMGMLKGCVQEAVGELKPGYREVYEMCEIEERTLQEAAEALGISVAAAKSRLHRARAQVRERLNQSICGR